MRVSRGVRIETRLDGGMGRMNRLAILALALWAVGCSGNAFEGLADDSSFAAQLADAQEDMNNGAWASAISTLEGLATSHPSDAVVNRHLVSSYLGLSGIDALNLIENADGGSTNNGTAAWDVMGSLMVATTVDETDATCDTVTPDGGKCIGHGRDLARDFLAQVSIGLLNKSSNTIVQTADDDLDSLTLLLGMASLQSTIIEIADILEDFIAGTDLPLGINAVQSAIVEIDSNGNSDGCIDSGDPDFVALSGAINGIIVVLDENLDWVTESIGAILADSPISDLADEFTSFENDLRLDVNFQSDDVINFINDFSPLACPAV